MTLDEIKANPEVLRHASLLRRLRGLAAPVTEPNEKATAARELRAGKPEDVDVCIQEVFGGDQDAFIAWVGKYGVKVGKAKGESSGDPGGEPAAPPDAGSVTPIAEGQAPAAAAAAPAEQGGVKPLT